MTSLGGKPGEHDMKFPTLATAKKGDTLILRQFGYEHRPERLTAVKVARATPITLIVDPSPVADEQFMRETGKSSNNEYILQAPTAFLLELARLHAEEQRREDKHWHQQAERDARRRSSPAHQIARRLLSKSEDDLVEWLGTERLELIGRWLAEAKS
jgi:hypothetical protein